MYYYISEDKEDLAEEDLVIQAATTSAIAATLAVLDYTQQYYNKRPFHDSALSGVAWVCELLSAYAESLGYTNMSFGLSSLLSKMLSTDIQSSSHSRNNPIFLYVCVTGLSLIHVCECFQWAPDTTSNVNSSFLFIIADQVLELQIFSPNVPLLFFCPIL